MILRLYGIADQAEQKDQRVVIKVDQDGNLKDYAIVDSTYNEGNMSNLHRHFYSFPDWEVKKGDQVILYTREGENDTEEKERKDGSKYTNHFFFWNLKISVWNPDDIAYILKIDHSTKYHFISKK